MTRIRVICTDPEKVRVVAEQNHGTLVLGPHGQPLDENGAWLIDVAGDGEKMCDAVRHAGLQVDGWTEDAPPIENIMEP